MAGTPINLNCNTNESVDETFACHQSNDPETEIFDRTIGLIEDAIMDEEFRLIQQEFLRKYAHEFDPELDENKLIYTDIHKEYLAIIENFILSKIQRSQPDFNLDLFVKQLQIRNKELEEDVFEFLLTFTDFLTFKQWMLDHRQSTTFDINSCLQSVNLQSALENNPISSFIPNHVNRSSNQQQSTSVDLSITGTKIKKSPDFQKN